MTSAVRVFGKSLHWLAAGWLAGVAWLWTAQIRRGWLLDPSAPTNFHLDTAIEGVIPALLVALTAFFFAAWTGQAPSRGIERREWLHAFWWALFPNIMILYTVYLMVFGEI